MTSDKFYNSLNSLFMAGRVGHVISVLQKKCGESLTAHPDLARVLSETERVEETYRHLRQFLIDGIPDPGREDIYRSLVARLRSLASEYLFIVNEDRLDPFFSDYRLQKVRNRSVADLADDLAKADYRLDMARVTEADTTQFERKKEDALSALFLKIWSLPPWASDDRKKILDLLESDESSFETRSQIITALLLGLLKFYDPGKFFILLRGYENLTDSRLAARALTAIVLVLARHSNLVLYDPEVKGALESLSDSILTYTRLREVVMTLIRTRDTDRVTREMTEAFNTTMKNISPELLEKMSREGISIDSGETGMNPEWEKLMQDKEIEKKMQAINDMQLEGMDVMMQTFSRLKSFPFFSTLPNWFLPFKTGHTAISPLFEQFDATGFEAMADATDMCASDRYSFALGLLQMPASRRNMVSATLGAQLESIRDLLKDKENIRKKPEFASEALVFARDLYRFAKLYPRKKDFYDPFEQPINFLRLPVLVSLLEEDELILAAADFYFRHGYYPQALNLYQHLTTLGEGAASIYERSGYCCQMQGDFQNALENYEKADLFSSAVNPSTTWLLKKLAFCNKALGYYGKAAEYYRKVLERNPDDLNLEYHLASVLLRAGETKQAREILAKINYLNPDHKLCSRAYTRLKGHDAFIKGDYKSALALYEEARGDQPQNEYRKDLETELGIVDPNADIGLLQILLDMPD